MKLSQLDDTGNTDTKQYKDFEIIYAKRHRIPVHWLRLNERLALACMLEWQVACCMLSLPQARRYFVDEFPDSNRLPVPRTVYESNKGKEGYWYVDDKYALGSVLAMILPYEDSIREVRPIQFKLDIAVEGVV